MDIIQLKIKQSCADALLTAFMPLSNFDECIGKNNKNLASIKEKILHKLHSLAFIAFENNNTLYIEWHI